MNRVRKVIIKLPALLQNLVLMDEPITRLLLQHEEFQIDEAEIYNVRLAVQELCSNIIRHAYQGQRGTVTLTLEMNPTTGWFTVLTQDKGKHHFDWDGSPPPNLDEPPEPERGIWLIRELMDEMSYDPLPTGSQWRLAKHFPRRAAPTPPAEKDLSA
jgi:serine/threonine-protein kinase RsbW